MPMMFFYFLKLIFDISTSKRSKKYKPHSILANKKKFKFKQNTGTNAIPNRSASAVARKHSFDRASYITQKKKKKGQAQHSRDR
jgi:hypothetical protein